MAILFTAQVKPVLTQEIFNWDVALIEPEKTESPTESTGQPAADQVPPAVRPVQPQLRPAPSREEPPPDPVTHRVAPQQTAQTVHPEVQPPKPIEQREEPPRTLKTEPMTPPLTPVPERTIEPVEQELAETPKTRPEPVMPTKEPEPLPPRESVLDQDQPVVPPAPDAVDTRSGETPAPSAPAPFASSSHAEPAPPIASVPSAAPQEAQVEAPKTAAAGDVKANARWMAESLRRRVAELQRYPASARLNGQQGKVVLLAVIRSDGHLAQVTVQKSSGHEVLDAAAIELVKLACPLHMKHAINTPQIAVSLPVAYILTN